MKKIYFSALATLALLMTSCTSGSLSISKREALNFIVEQSGGVITETVTLPNKIKSHYELRSMFNSNSYDAVRSLLNVYQNAGLVTIKDTTTTYTQWGRTKYTEAVDLQLTAKGREAITNETTKGIDVLDYRYEYDDLVDLRLLATVENEDYDATKLVYLAFYKGTVIEASAYANAMGITADSQYPLYSGGEKPIMSCVITAIFRGSELISLNKSNTHEIGSSQIEAYFNEEWLDMAF